MTMKNREQDRRSDFNLGVERKACKIRHEKYRKMVERIESYPYREGILRMM